MNDLTTRLRRWTHDVDAVPASDLMDEAADEIERLRAKPVTEPMPEPPAGRGNVTPEPVAWAVASLANNDLRTFHKSREDAESQIAEAVQLGIVRYADTMRVVPLYRQPQDWAFLNNEIVRLRLTDAEREAIHCVVGDVADITGPVEDTLRGLLERLS